MNPLSAPNMTDMNIPEFDAAAFEVLARSRLLPNPPLLNEPHSPGDDDLNPGSERIPAGLRHAAVLVPIIAHSPLTVLLTTRTDHLPSHAGQIAFPGGKVETHDAGPLAAALRETREEIALDAAFIEPLGFLPPYRTGTGYIITPSVALVRPGFKLTADPEEVAAVFEVPFAFLMNEANHQIHSRVYGGVERHFYAMPYGERYIWGATAGIIRTLYRRLFST
ncbi:CoA pyrophosphatase [Hyphomicrobium sp. 99]|uniref:CoA pyrophosphatase n=1 Tax=Hyphomicrobium sp. 99 TaxID=1163419 RepID=UPI0005F85996|nr:CoA pyrophosphatase [Hyphomicrobium sp. 99]